MLVNLITECQEQKTYPTTKYNCDCLDHRQFMIRNLGGKKPSIEMMFLL